MGSRWFYVAALIGIMAHTSFASPSVLVHEWEVDSQTKGGKTVSCFVELKLVSEQEAVSMNLSLFGESNTPQKVQAWTGLKIRALKQDGSQIKVHSGWVRSSSGSTVGKLKKVDHPEMYFLGAASGPDLFVTILKGILRDGASVGYQETLGKFDKVFKIVEPLPDGSARALSSCIDDLRSSLSK